MASTIDKNLRSALIVGHPGHELRVLGWVKRTQPIVASLTDGSGHSQYSRVEMSRNLLARIGATPTNLYGMSSDREIYSRILAGDYAFFINASQLLATMLVEHKIECVVGDAIEGYNPAHDLCRVIIDRAVKIASVELGYPLLNYRFPLVAHPSFFSNTHNSLSIMLTKDEIAMKFLEASNYAEAASGILGSEVKESIFKFGKTAFEQETLYFKDAFTASVNVEERPFYELYGEKQVKAGIYKFVIRYREHILPIVNALLI